MIRISMEDLSMPTITLYNLIHGPEVWLGVVGLCWISTIGIVIGSAIYFVKKDKSDPPNQNERKNK